MLCVAYTLQHVQAQNQDVLLGESHDPRGISATKTGVLGGEIAAFNIATVLSREKTGCPGFPRIVEVYAIGDSVLLGMCRVPFLPHSKLWGLRADFLDL